MPSDAIARQILLDWLGPLSDHLGRPADEIRDRGLSAGDFPLSAEVRLAFPDGSSAQFRHAFHVADAAGARVAVFTEHCGYHVFPARGTRVEVVRREWRGEG